ncbi:MAG: DUF177 domain-containing protein [Acidimicrobiia bacterium]
MSPELVLRVDDLIGHPEKSRVFTGSRVVSLRLGDSTVTGPMQASGVVVGTVDGVQASFTTRAVADLRCVRCLTEWVENIEVEGSQHFSKIPDEDGYVIVGGQVDLGAPITDELALGIPLAPLCRRDCRGLCPVCGNDLNTDPCDGHGDDTDSPFAALKDLFDP